MSTRRLGYLMWSVAGCTVGVPELIAARDENKLPFTTISKMVGHLERHETWVGLIVIAVIVLAVYSLATVPPNATAAPSQDAAGNQPVEIGQPGRTPGGRLTLRTPNTDALRAEYEQTRAPREFLAAAFISFAGIAGATWAAASRWEDSPPYRPAYVLYGLIGLLWIIIPNLVALGGKDVPFPTLFRTVSNFQEWLRGWSWRPKGFAVGVGLAWLVGYVILAGLVILLLHLTLYPYPDITHIINPDG